MHWWKWASLWVKKAKRQITRATFEKWQKEHQMLSLLQCDLHTKGTHMVSLSTVLYVESMKLTYNHSKTSGEIGLRVWQTRTSNLIDHATSDIYKAATAKLKVECSRARGDTSTTIKCFLSSMDDTQQRMAKKFDVCFTEKKTYCSPNTLRC